MMTSILRQVVGDLLAATVLAARVAAVPMPWPASVPERLAALPKGGVPLEAPAVIHWNAYQVPFIEAQTDRDLAFVLGLVHAHLRLAQMEMLRRIAQGRISELLGPIGFEFDHALRIMDFGRAATACLAAMPAETRDWLDTFVAGLNYYQANVEPLPHEFAALGIEGETWTAADILSIARLMQSDAHWLVWFRLLSLRGRSDWPELWRSVVARGTASLADREDKSASPSRLARLLMVAVRHGSNAVALSKARSASGGALLAGDPHLGILIPNHCFVGGYRSPSHHAVGLMFPGLPFVAIGRNPWIAWGGTNLHAAASDLVDVSHLAPEAVSWRRERIAVRWWGNEEITARDTPFGPIVTDARMLRSGRNEELALHWLGHHASDEITAMLRVGRARNWQEFLAAIGDLAIPGHTFVFADEQGHIGKAMAAKIPARPPGAPPDLATPLGRAQWTRCVSACDLAFAHDPPEGFVVSANEPPADDPYAVGTFFSPFDRARRLADLISTESAMDVPDLAAVLTDVYSSSAIAIRDRLLSAMRPANHMRSRRRRRLIESLANWDGRYSADSTGAVAFELLLQHFLRRFFGRTRLAAYAATWDTRRLVLRDLEAAAPDRIAAALTPALGAAATGLGRYRNWGEMHRLRLWHPFALLPIVGRRYRYADRSANGGGETICKTAHDGTARRHAARYGSIARYVFDLADPDRNYFVLLGGEDGWLGSAGFLDQLPLWERNGFMQLPLRPETVRANFPFQSGLMPAGGEKNRDVAGPAQDSHV